MSSQRQIYLIPNPSRTNMYRELCYDRLESLYGRKAKGNGLGTGYHAKAHEENV